MVSRYAYTVLRPAEQYIIDIADGMIPAARMKLESRAAEGDARAL